MNNTIKPIPLNHDILIPVGCSMTLESGTVRVVKNPEVIEDDEPTYVKLKNISFKDGIIKLKVKSQLHKDAPDHARGFIGVAFRINDDDSMFEAMYIRPLNARCDNQIRRNHSTQYFSYPDYKYFTLRNEFPEKYESYADLAMNEWIDITIKVLGTNAELYLNHHPYPSLIVNDLKHGPDVEGSVAMWVDIGTEGYFKDIEIIDL